MERRDAWIFIGLFAFIFVIWIALGGTFRAPAFTTPALPSVSLRAASSTLTASAGYPLLPRSPYVVGGESVCLTGSTNCASSGTTGTQASGGTNANPVSTPVPSGVTGVVLTAPSQYRGVVSMSSYVANASSSNPKNEYVQISVAQNASSPVDITRWVLASGATGKSEVIPKGTLLPTSGIVNPVDDIVLQPGDSAIIVSGESPVGASFRENKCIGYFNSFQKFTPSLPNNCPAASTELSSSYGTPYIHDPSCIEYVKSISRCETAVPTASDKLSLTCQDFIESHLNYNSCLAYHRADADFNGRVWHIYLGRPAISPTSKGTDAGPLWRSKYEVVELLDDRGKTVATFNY